MAGEPTLLDATEEAPRGPAMSTMATAERVRTAPAETVGFGRDTDDTQAIATRAPSRMPQRAINLQGAEADVMMRLLDLASTDIDVGKLDKLMQMYERRLDAQKEEAFADALAAMQADLPIVLETGLAPVGREESRNLRSFAKQSDILRAVRPVLAKHGFSLRFQSEYGPLDARPAEGIPALKDRQARIVGWLQHARGHKESDWMIVTDDDGPSRNAIQARGSARQYAMRYLTRSLLNIASDEYEDDGTGAPDEPRRRAPKAAQRRSQAPDQQQPRQQPAPQAQRERLDAQGKNVGTIANFQEDAGRALVELSTGFVCGTRDPETIAALRSHYNRPVGQRAVLELSCDPPQKPGNAPKIIEIAVRQ